MALTVKQRRLQEEIDEIASTIGIDYWNIEEYDVDGRTPILQVIKNKIIRGEVIMRYTLIDEFLTLIICNYYFRRPKRGQTFKQLWRTKRFKIFNHQIMDETYLLPKMRTVDAIKKIPNDVRTKIERINALRNDIAHSFFPENRKAHMPSKARLYQGADIFSKAGVELFLEDVHAVSEYLERRAFGFTLAY